MSADSDDDEFKEYYEDMPWAAVPYSAEEVRSRERGAGPRERVGDACLPSSQERDGLNETFKVEGIPRLVILKGGRLG